MSDKSICRMVDWYHLSRGGWGKSGNPYNLNVEEWCTTNTLLFEDRVSRATINKILFTTKVVLRNVIGDNVVF